MSLPITTRWRCAPRVKMRPAAMPAFIAISGVSAEALVRPRMPSVPKYLRVMEVTPESCKRPVAF